MANKTHEKLLYFSMAPLFFALVASQLSEPFPFFGMVVCFFAFLFASLSFKASFSHRYAPSIVFSALTIIFTMFIVQKSPLMNLPEEVKVETAIAHAAK